MKGITVLLTNVAIASLLGCGQINVLLPNLSSQTADEWSAEEHRVAADLFEEEAARLETKMAYLDQRVERFTKKPYLEPKGFRRQGWKRLMGTYRGKIADLREQIAWHQQEAERFNAMPPSDDIEKRKEGKKG